ncbi:hypothetical protein C8R43DRAFT_654584 [Mycena crocata]|nr:hypothetical protein C8R43DRAFT_654584 [Mycena crocata]
MVNSLDDARHQSSDLPTAPNLILTSRTSTGGRPRIDIDPAFLSQALELRGPTHLCQVFSASARTICRRALDYGLAQPGVPVYRHTTSRRLCLACLYLDISTGLHHFRRPARHTSDLHP